jgi:hypothetical protein
MTNLLLRLKQKPDSALTDAGCMRALDVPQSLPSIYDWKSQIRCRDSLQYSTTAGATGYQYYNTPFTSTTLNVGATHATVNLYAMVVNDFQMWGGDELFFRADSSPFGSFELQFLDTSMAALTSLAMPTAVDAAKFGAVNLSLNDYSTRTYFRNPVSTFAPASASVPEPGSIALFGAALATLALARRRKTMR